MVTAPYLAFIYLSVSWHNSLNIQYLFTNNKGRDFVCGDIHGCFNLLEEKLAEVEFDPCSDRLFSVGDTIDRGADSEQALHYFEKQWFYCVRGNHEQMFLDWITEETPVFRNDAFRFHIHNGGLWVADFLGIHIQKLADDMQQEGHITQKYPALRLWADAIKKLPYAIEIKSKDQRIGIIHAEIPDTVKWTSLESELHKTNILYSILFSRKFIQNQKLKNYQIQGVDAIYCGHTILEKPITKGNVHYIDTGAYTRKTLTLIELT